VVCWPGWAAGGRYSRGAVFVLKTVTFIEIMQVLPSKELLPFIKHYLFLDCTGIGVSRLRLFSDGNTGMVFSQHGNLIADIPGSRRIDYLPKSFVYGQVSVFKDLFAEQNTSLIIVVFQPDGIHRLLGIPANEISESMICTEDLFGWQGLILQEKLYEQVDPEAKLHLLDTFFLTIASRQAIAHQPLIETSIHFIFKNRGSITIDQLVKKTGYTERHIERVFRECIGLNPKKFGKIVQLHHFLKLVKEKSGPTTLTGLCYEAGYYDQSHLNKEFKKYTGITPMQYMHKTIRLAVNFMDINAIEAPMSGSYNLWLSQ
jgi:AraC-like DNA-binding protein